MRYLHKHIKQSQQHFHFKLPFGNDHFQVNFDIVQGHHRQQQHDHSSLTLLWLRNCSERQVQFGSSYLDEHVDEQQQHNFALLRLRYSCQWTVSSPSSYIDNHPRLPNASHCGQDCHCYANIGSSNLLRPERMCRLPDRDHHYGHSNHSGCLVKILVGRFSDGAAEQLEPSADIYMHSAVSGFKRSALQR
jgi:hypothetical protein